MAVQYLCMTTSGQYVHVTDSGTLTACGREVSSIIADNAGGLCMTCSKRISYPTKQRRSNNPITGGTVTIKGTEYPVVPAHLS